MTIGIIGYGRFGKLLNDIFKGDFDIATFDVDDSLEALADCDTLFLCVPIRHLEATLSNIAAHIHPQATVIDTCSVKVYPVECMQRQLPATISIIATHPLFGPDSYFQEHQNRIMMYPVQHTETSYPLWKDYFTRKNLHIIEMTPDAHDRFAARTQGITHLLGRMLQQMNIGSTPIDTLGFERLLAIMNQTCNDSWDLFYDLQKFNPYTHPLIDEIEETLKKLRES